MPFTGPLEDRLLIRELYDSYADAACRMDRADWLTCWTEDSFWQTHYFDVSGINAIAAQYDAIMANVVTTSFFNQLAAIEIYGDRAKGRAICRERLLMQGDLNLRLTGRYEDDLVRDTGGWRFARRIYHVMLEEGPA